MLCPTCNSPVEATDIKCINCRTDLIKPLKPEQFDVSFSEFVIKNSKKYLNYFLRYSFALFISCFICAQIVLVFYFLLGKLPKIVFVFSIPDNVILFLKCIPIGAFGVTLHAVISEWQNEKNDYY